MEKHRYLIILLFLSTFVSKSEVLATDCQNTCVNGYYDICNAVNDNFCDCYCDEACYLFEDCCQNSTRSHTTETDTDVSISTGISCGYIGNNPCKIVDSCINILTSNETTRAKCEDVSDDISYTDVNKFPVFGYSSDIALVYKNQFCALCNIEEDFELILPGIISGSCNVFKLLEMLPVDEKDIGKTINYLAAELHCELTLDAASRMIHCRRCGCTNNAIWSVLSYDAGFIQVNYLQEAANTYDCVIKQYNSSETTISDGVCSIGEKYMAGSCVKIFSVMAPTRTSRFIHILMDQKMDIDSYAFDTAVEFIEAAKRAAISQMEIYTDWLLSWQVRTIRGKNNISLQTCSEIQLDMIFEGDILEDQLEVFMIEDLFEICEECQQKNTFLPMHLLPEPACDIPYCEFSGIPDFGLVESWETATLATDYTSLANTTENAPVTNTPETSSNGTKEPDDHLGTENRASPCIETSTLYVISVGLSFVAFKVVFPPIT